MPSMSTREGIGTHDSIFTRGYWAGYCQAMRETHSDFIARVLCSQVADLVAVLESSGAVCTVGEPERGVYRLLWCRLEARFP